MYAIDNDNNRRKNQYNPRVFYIVTINVYYKYFILCLLKINIDLFANKQFNKQRVYKLYVGIQDNYCTTNLPIFIKICKQTI